HYWHKRYEWCLKSSWCIRHFLAHHHDTDAYKRKCKERTNTHHMPQVADRNKTGEYAYEDHEKQVSLPWCAEFRMYFTKEFWQQAVIRHGVEHATLTHQHHQYHRSITCEYGEYQERL